MRSATTTTTEKHMEAKVIGIAVERGKNVVHLIVNGSRVVIDTNIVGFAALAKAGIPVIGVSK
jgi:hypothetical protein